MIVKIRRSLRNVYFLRSTYFFFYTLLERARYKRPSVMEGLVDLLREQEDPWSYRTNPEEVDRFRSAMEMLNMAQNGDMFANALEVGCSEGVFTSMLAPRCKSLLAVDISQAALQRAEQRCTQMHIRFDQWDLFTSPAPTNLDLIVVMDVLELFFNPADIRFARDKLVNALQPGGYLLVGNSRQNDVFETSCWSRWMLRGGARIAEFFAENSKLDLIASEKCGIYVNALFQMRASNRLRDGS